MKTYKIIQHLTEEQETLLLAIVTGYTKLSKNEYIISVSPAQLFEVAKNIPYNALIELDYINAIVLPIADNNGNTIEYTDSILNAIGSIKTVTKGQGIWYDTINNKTYYDAVLFVELRNPNFRYDNLLDINVVAKQECIYTIKAGNSVLHYFDNTQN